MKTATFTSLRIDPELSQAAEELLPKGETLSSFVEQPIRKRVAHRQLQNAFISRGLRSANDARRSGAYSNADDVVGRLEQMLASAKAKAGK